MTRAVFIQSYDCEGRWGVADHLSAADRRRLTGASLRETYQRLARTLAHARTPATFAWVGMFALTADAASSRLSILRALHQRCPGYLDAFFEDLETAALDGWIGAECLAIVQAGNMHHEIGAHGFSHIPWTWPGFNSQAAQLELEGLRSALQAPTTFVFPRNAVGDHVDALGHAGFAGYRANRVWRSRAARLLREANLFEAPEPHPLRQAPVPIPGGQFLNTRFGVRRSIPTQVTILRWRRLIDAACRRRRVAHLWLHPENLVCAPDGFDVLTEILDHVGRRRDAGDIEIMTQADYCRSMATAQ